MLIGDSVTRNIRSALEVILNNAMSVDLFAASFAITDQLFWKNLHNFWDYAYTYTAIIINYGFHHDFGCRCCEDSLDLEKIKDGYRSLVELCKKYCENIIIMNGTSMRTIDDISKIDTWCEKEISARNEAVKSVAKEHGCRYFDVNSLMKINKQYSYTDHVHFEHNAYSFIAYSLVTDISLLNRDEYQRTKREFRNYLSWKDNKEYIIYGAGQVGVRLYFALKYYGLDKKIFAWASTDTIIGETTLFEKPVYEISRIEPGGKAVIIAVGSKIESKKMKLCAESNGFDTVVLF